MLKKPFKILMVTDQAALRSKVTSIYVHIPHQIERLSCQDFKENTAASGGYDLLLLDNRSKSFDKAAVAKILEHSGTQWQVVISANKEADAKRMLGAQTWVVEETNEANQLFAALSEIYEQFVQSNRGHSQYWQILAEGLNSLEMICLIIDEAADIVFVNDYTRRLLKIETEWTDNSHLSDYLLEGNKVIRHIKEHFTQFRDDLDMQDVSFMDNAQQTVMRNVRVKQLQSDAGFFLISDFKGADVADEAKLTQEPFYSLEELSDSIAHTLLNPMNIISGRLQLLKGDPDLNQRLSKSLEILDNQVSRINVIMDRLLTFARLREDTVPQKIQINEILKRLRLEPAFANLFNEQTEKLQYALAEELPDLAGVVSHYDLLLKLLIELALQCVGADGKIQVQTGIQENYKMGRNIRVTFLLNYGRSFAASQNTLHGYFDYRQETVRSIETDIIKHILSKYKSSLKVSEENNQIERLDLLFPIKQKPEGR